MNIDLVLRTPPNNAQQYFCIPSPGNISPYCHGRLLDG